MNKDKEQLVINVQNLEKAVDYLQESYNLSKKVDFPNASREDLILIESLVGRFGRVVDMLVGKVLRMMDKIEYEEQGTLIDLSNRAEKRLLVESASDLRNLKTLRNSLVHEYNDEDMMKYSQSVFDKTAKLLEIIKKTIDYCRGKNLI